MRAQLHPFTVKLAVVFLLVGYGTKAGLAPMHTWKPDAYREAPSPAGVLMAVGMMNCSLYAILRVHLVVEGRRWGRSSRAAAARRWGSPPCSSPRRSS